MELRQELKDRSKIHDWAWSQCDVDDTPMKKLVPGIRERGYLTKLELIEVAKWKVPKKRNTHCHVIKNHPDKVKEMTLSAFRETVGNSSYYLWNQPQRNMGLHGVGIPVGSAILHWFHEGRYPIWDKHARWSVRLNECQHQYKNDYERWHAYVEFCRSTADKYEVCMRTLDRALLQYGKDNNSRSC